MPSINLGPLETSLLIILVLSLLAVIMIDLKEIRSLRRTIIKGTFQRVWMLADLNDQLLLAGHAVGERVDLKHGSVVVSAQADTDRIRNMIEHGELSAKDIKEIIKNEEET
jgi:hypothetical protein